MTPEKEPMGVADSAAEDQAEAPVDQQAEGQDEQPNVTPEEQKMYDATFTAALNAIYNDDQIKIIIRKLAAGKDNISNTIGHSAAMIMTSLKRTAEGKGKQIPDDILYEVGQDVIGELCNIAIGSKIMNSAQLQDVANAALYEAMRVWGQSMQTSGGMTPDKVEQAKQDLADRGIKQQAPQQGQQPPAAGAQPPAPPAAAPPQPGIINQAGA